MRFPTEEKNYDIVIAGGGLPGVCAAIAAARLGKRVALVNNRGYIGGNASAEILVAVCGATGAQEFNFFAREDGIVEEILLENLHRNPSGNRYIWDSVLLDFIYAEENIDMYLNTTVCEAECEEDEIKSVLCVSSLSEKQFRMRAHVYIDDTGDGTLGYLAGAEFMVGREARETFGEAIAPEKADRWVLPSTMLFHGKDTGAPVKYIPPKFALDIKTTKLLENRVIPPDNFARNQWYYELGGDKEQTGDIEQIIRDQRAFVYGIWDYIKNSGKFDADNYDFEYVSCIPGKREWRRLTGDVIITEKDVTEQTQWEDAVGWGGWSIDLHSLEGIYSDDIQNRHYILRGIFRIPYRALYSKNIKNLMMASRCLSASHVAHGATRLIATLSMLGQAVGTAASVCVDEGCTPRDIYLSHMDKLRSLLLSADHTVLSHPYADERDLARRARITVSSTLTPESMLASDGFKSMSEGDGFAVSTPVGEGVKEVSLLVRSEHETKLSYRIYFSSNMESYDPAVLAFENYVDVPATGGEGMVVHLPIGAEADGRYIFLDIDKNDSLAIGYKREITPLTVSMIKCKNKRETTWDAYRLCVKDCVYRQPALSFCFSVGEIHSASQLANGFTRPYGRTNMWVSDGACEGEYIDLKLDRTHKLSELVLTFDSGLNREYRNSRSYDFSVMPELITGYGVYAYTSEGEQLVYSTDDNYQRVNRIDLAGIECDRLRVLFKSTGGIKRACVYNVSLFGEEK